MVSQLHQLLLQLIPGGAKKDLSAARARTLLASVRPRDAAGKVRRRVAAEFITDLERVYPRKKAANKELEALLAETGTSLLKLNGIGHSGAARLLVEVGDITRFPSRAHVASWNGAAPIDASSGEHVRHRLWISDYGYDETLHGFEKSAGKLGVDQIDLLILHQPLPSAFDRTLEAYRALETLLADGKVRTIGVSNFMVEHLAKLLDRATVVPAVNQIEVHPYFAQREVQHFGAEHGILTQAWSPIAASPSTATVATAAPSTTRSSERSPGPTARPPPR
jgi:hypothetical protein